MRDKKVIDEQCEWEGIVSDGEGGWSNDHAKFDFGLFRCYWCLSPYKEWEQSRNCPCDKSGIAAQMIR